MRWTRFPFYVVLIETKQTNKQTNKLSVLGPSVFYNIYDIECIVLALSHNNFIAGLFTSICLVKWSGK